MPLHGRSPDVRVLRNSRIYETEPVDYKDQAWFLNQVVEAETALFPMQLLTRIGRVELEPLLQPVVEDALDHRAHFG